jgi:hypothetical protein
MKRAKARPGASMWQKNSWICWELIKLAADNSNSMKSPQYRIAVAFLFLFISISCQHDDLKLSSGKIEISFTVKSKNSPGGRVAVSGAPEALFISVEDQNGTVIFDRKKIKLIAFGNDFLSEPLSFNVGDYKLTEFIVADKNDDALYAIPLENS